MLSLPIATWERLAIWMAIGIVIYVLYGRRRSKIGR
jgi:APA family basic amino acid/polyamine antiporter